MAKENAGRPSPFLFINENERSRPLANRKVHSTRINRHVHRFFADRLREERRAALEVSSQNTKMLVGWCSNSSRQRQLLPSPAKHKKPNADKDKASKHALATPVIKDNVSQPAKCDLVAPNGDDYPIFTANFSDGDCVDPFNCTGIPLKRHVQPILQYYVSGFSIPGLFKMEMRQKPAHRHRHYSSVEQVFRGCLSDKMHMYALLAFTAARMKIVAKCPLRHAATPEYFLNEAIMALRAYLAFPNPNLMDERVIIDIHCLSSFEWYFQNYEAASVHLRILGHIIAFLPSTSPLYQYIQELTRYQDVGISIESFTPPIIPLTWDTASLPADRWRHMGHELRSASVQRMGRGFADALAHGFFDGPAFNTAISELIPFTLVAQYTWLSFQILPSDAEWMNRKAFALLHRLLCLHVIQNHDSFSSLQIRRREECCRIGLIIALSYICTSMAAARSGRMNLRRLRIALGEVDSFECDYWGPSRLQSELLFWVLVTGLSTTIIGERGAASEMEEDDEQQQWFLQRVVRVSRARLGIETRAQLYTVTRRYMYFEPLHASGLAKIATRLGV